MLNPEGQFTFSDSPDHEKTYSVSSDLLVDLNRAKNKASQLRFNIVPSEVILWSLIGDPVVQSSLSPDSVLKLTQSLEKSEELNRFGIQALSPEEVFLNGGYFRRADEIRVIEGANYIEPMHFLFAISGAPKVRDIIHSSDVDLKVFENEILAVLPQNKTKQDEYIASLPQEIKEIYLKPEADRSHQESRSLVTYQTRRSSTDRARRSR